MHVYPKNTHSFLLVSFITIPIFAMQTEGPCHNFSTLCKDIFLQICVKIHGSNIQDTIHNIHTLRKVCKTWCTMLNNQVEIVSMLPLLPMHHAAATDNVDEIIKLTLESQHSVYELDDIMHLPSDYAVALKQHKAIKILGVARALRNNQKSKLAIPKRDYTQQDMINAITNDQSEELEDILLKDQRTGYSMLLLLDLTQLPMRSQRCKDRISYTMRSHLETTFAGCMNETIDCPPLWLAKFQSYGANPNAYTMQGTTLLHNACLSANTLLSLKFLLKHKNINVNCVCKNTNLKGATPLHCAAYSGSLEACKLLIASSANTTARTAFGETALDIANQIKLHLHQEHNKKYEDTVHFLTAYATTQATT
jgi:ankyrin repeat protein